MTPRTLALACGLALLGAASALAQPAAGPAPAGVAAAPARLKPTDVLTRPFARPAPTPVAAPGRAPAGPSAAGVAPAWARAFGSGYAGPAARTVATAVAADGTVYALGEALRPGGGPAVFLAKYAADGAEVWRAWHDAAPATALRAAALVLDAGGRPVAVVTEDRFDIDVATSRDVLVRRYSAAGVPEWTARYGEDGRASLVSSAAAGDGGTYVAGATYPTLDDAYPDPFVLRVGPDGQLAWASVVEGGSAGDFGMWTPGFFDVAALPGGGAVAVGAVEASGAPPLRGGGTHTSAFAVVRFTAAGAVDVASALQPTGAEATATAVAVDPAGAAYVAGFAGNDLGGHTPLFARFTPATSPTVWTGAPAPEVHIPAELRRAPDGALYAAGVTWGPETPTGAYVERFDGVAAPAWASTSSGLALFGEQQRPVRLVLTPGGPVAAWSAEDGLGGAYLVVDAYDAEGNSRWNAPVGGTGSFVVGMALAARPGGGVVAGGFEAADGGTGALAVAFPDGPAPAWDASYTGATRDSDTGVAVAADPRGGATVAGRADGGRDAAVVLANYDAAGVARWTRLHHPEALDFPDDHALLPTADGGAYLVVSGLTDEVAGARTEVARFDADGEVVWTTTLLGRHARLAAAPDGGVIVARGHAVPVGDGWDTDVRVARLTATGATAWETTLDVSDPFVAGVAADGAGGAYVLYEEDPIAPAAGPYLVRVGPTGTVLWTAGRPLPERLSGLWRTVAVAPDGDAVTLTCEEVDFDPCALARVVRFAAADGAVRGTADLPGLGTSHLAVGPDGLAYVAGSAFDEATGKVEIRAAAVSATGAVVWSRAHEVPDLGLFPVGAAAAPGALYALYLGGSVFGGIHPVLAHLDPADGALVLTVPGGTDLPGDALPAALTVGADGAPYAVGTLVPATGSQLLAIGYAPAVTTGDEPGAPAGVLALTAAPNPARGRARLTVHLPGAAATARIEVFDALGRRVATAHDGPLTAGVQEVEIAVEGLAPGAYVVRLTTPAAAATARLTVVR